MAAQQVGMQFLEVSEKKWLWHSIHYLFNSALKSWQFQIHLEFDVDPIVLPPLVLWHAWPCLIHKFLNAEPRQSSPRQPAWAARIPAAWVAAAPQRIRRRRRHEIRPSLRVAQLDQSTETPAELLRVVSTVGGVVMLSYTTAPLSLIQLEILRWSIELNSTLDLVLWWSIS